MHVCDQKIEVPCGEGAQHIRWLGLNVAARYQKEFYPHAFRVPQRVLAMDGTLLRPRAVIHETLADGDEVVVELRQGANIPEDLYDDDAAWIEEAYGESSNLMECKFRWKVDAKADVSIPAKVRGDYFVAPKWSAIYPQKEYGGRFEIPLEPVEVGEGQLDWVASRKGPPGNCSFKFVMDDGSEYKDGQQNHIEFTWDVPIASEPYPEIDSRPSTASSRDGAQVDPRFEQDWEAMRLRWVESYMKVRVKDVLTEFYAILIDLFDSYAFMGLDLSTNQHTIGMDDFFHLVYNCSLLSEQPNGTLPWEEVGGWYQEAANVKDGRPFLSQRLTRAHYLELLLRVAHWEMCEHPKPKYTPSGGASSMPLDEGLFRFITDMLIPVMDVYDDDPIRKDAVQHHNLIAIQQNRPSIRSAYSFLSLPWPFMDRESLVPPYQLKFVLEFARDKLGNEGGGGGGGEGEEKKEDGESAKKAFEMLSGDDKLNAQQLAVIIENFDRIMAEQTEKHPKALEERAMVFWEYFEVLMQCCRLLAAQGEQLHLVIPAFVMTQNAVIQLVEDGQAELPPPPMMDEGEELEGGEPAQEG